MHRTPPIGCPRADCLFQELFPNFKASLSGDHGRVRDSEHRRVRDRDHGRVRGSDHRGVRDSGHGRVRDSDHTDHFFRSFLSSLLFSYLMGI